MESYTPSAILGSAKRWSVNYVIFFMKKQIKNVRITRNIKVAELEKILKAMLFIQNREEDVSLPGSRGHVEAAESQEQEVPAHHHRGSWSSCPLLCSSLS
jgi:hypothetical protein